uniref:Uncharacterized protein n=1 Tax=Ixodes ricinus TaxID=34613 RepID=A0A6B0U5X7_IXORI
MGAGCAASFPLYALAPTHFSTAESRTRVTSRGHSSGIRRRHGDFRSCRVKHREIEPLYETHAAHHCSCSTGPTGRL